MDGTFLSAGPSSSICYRARTLEGRSPADVGTRRGAGGCCAVCNEERFAANFDFGTRGNPVKERSPLNNNRGNNRRRGRGNNRPQGGGQQLNRIDSRARGNAPQMLEKYRKLAHDAHLNGDRVTAEYYLQFADHYFRVIADTRTRQEEQRLRRDDRWEDRGDEGDEAAEFSVESEFPTFEQPYSRREREERGESPREERPREERPREDRPREERQRGERSREDRPREDRPRRRDERGDNGEANAPAAVDGNVAESDADEARSPYEPVENPFVRESRSRGLKPRREDRRPRRDAVGEAGTDVAFDAAILPPAIGAREDTAPGADADVAAEAPAPKRRARKPKIAAEGDEAA